MAMCCWIAEETDKTSGEIAAMGAIAHSEVLLPEMTNRAPRRIRLISVPWAAARRLARAKSSGPCHR